MTKQFLVKEKRGNRLIESRLLYKTSMQADELCYKPTKTRQHSWAVYAGFFQKCPKFIKKRIYFFYFVNIQLSL